MSETGNTEKNTDQSNKHIRGSSLLFGGRLISVGLKAILQIFIVRYLVKEDYGAFAYAMSFIEIGAIIALVNIDQAAARFMPQYVKDEDYASILGFILLSLFTIFGIGLSIVVFIIGAQSMLLDTVIQDQLTLTLLALLIILVPLQAMDSWFQSMFAVFNSIKQIFFRRYLLAPVLQLVTILFVIASQSGIYVLTLGYLFTGVIGLSLYITMFSSLLRRKKILQHLSWRNLKFNFGQVFGFSLPLLSSSFVLIFRSQFAIILLEFLDGLTAVAEYRAMQPIAKLNGVVYGSFVIMYLPIASRLLANEDEQGINDLYWRTAAWIALASFPIFVVTFVLSGTFVPVIFGEQYRNASSVMAILALGYYTNALMGFNIHTLRAYGKVRYLFFVDIVVMFVAVISYFVFIPFFGAVGGAIAYALALVSGNVLNHLGLVRHTKVTLFDPSYLQVYISILVATIGIAAIQFLLSPPLIVALIVVGIVALGLIKVNAKLLDILGTFPELRKIPIAKSLLK